MVSRWSERDTLKLIQLYKSYEFLWDKDTDLYKNIFARKQAYSAIVNEMGLQGLTTQDVRCKIKNLRTSYYQELRKMASYRAKNKTLRPLRWFVAFKSIMGSISHDSATTPSNNKPAESNSESEDYEEEEEQPVQEESFFLEESTSNSDAYVVSIKQEFLDEMDNLGDKVMPPTICDYLEPVVSKRCKPQPEPTTKKRQIEEEIPSTSSLSKKSKKVDEFQMFANNIAQQLRKLPLNRALNLQIEVQTMIAKERIEMLNKQGDNTNNDEESS